MKRIFQYALTLCLLCSIYSVNAQVRKVPVEVTEAFRQKYPMATNLEWRDRLTGFTASFDLENVHYEARFTNKGFWQNTENKLADADIPAAVKDGFQKSKYAGEWTIKQAYKIALRENVIQYRLEIQKGDIQKKNLLFNTEGRLLKDNFTL
jgi:hypothetical protein